MTFDPSAEQKAKASEKKQGAHANEDRKYAIPVGTGNVIEFDKFLFDHRDKSCNKCKNGYKSVVPKTIGTKVFSIPIICICVPYIQSEDKEGNMVVNFKGFRELWPDGDRPEAYIQKEIKTKAVTDTVKAKINKVRNSNTAHNNVQKGKYVIGKQLVTSKNAQELEKHVDTARPASSVKPIKKDEFDKFFENNKRKAAFRNREGNIVVVDEATAQKMMKAGVLFDPNPAPAPAEGEGGTPAEGNTPPPANTPAAPAVKKRAGRPKGSKNKPKAV